MVEKRPLAPRPVRAGAVVIWIKGKRRRRRLSVRSLLAHEDRAWLLLGRALAAQDSLVAARTVLEEGLGRASTPAEAAEFLLS